MNFYLLPYHEHDYSNIIESENWNSMLCVAKWPKKKTTLSVAKWHRCSKLYPQLCVKVRRWVHITNFLGDSAFSLIFTHIYIVFYIRIIRLQFYIYWGYCIEYWCWDQPRCYEVWKLPILLAWLVFSSALLHRSSLKSHVYIGVHIQVSRKNLQINPHCSSYLC